MPCVGFLLRPQKRPRVLTPTLTAAAAARGLSLLALDPASTPDDWREAGVDVLVHKVPDEPGLDARLQDWADAAADGVLLDPPAAVRQLQDRQQMLAPLAGQPLVLTQAQEPGDPDAQAGSSSSTQTVVVSIPQQAVLQPGCSMDQAGQQLSAAGLQFPLLVKPLISAATDSTRPAGPADSSDGQTLQAAAAAAVNDGHTLGALFSEQGLQSLIASQQPQQQQVTPIPLPAMLQQYVPHEALYKLYVIGQSCVLTRRNTLTPALLEAAAAAAAADGEPQGGVVILPRLSADKLAAVAAAQQQQQQLQVAGSSRGAAGAVLADVSVQGDPQAPPLWAMQQLAARLREALRMSLFNVDIIVPSSEQQDKGARLLLVVDINYFPGIDKVPGGEQLFANLLAECAGCCCNQ